MHVLRGLRGDQAAERLSELRRRFCAAADPADEGVAHRRLHGETSAVRQARASEIFAGGHRGALRASERRSARGAVALSFVIASEAKQSIYPLVAPWIASSLRSSQRRRQASSCGNNRPLDLAEADAIAVALAPAAHHK